MNRLLFAIVALAGLVLAGCGSTDYIGFRSTGVDGLELGANPAQGELAVRAGIISDNAAFVPQTVETQNGRIQLRSEYREWYENGGASIEAIDGPSTCGVFSGFANGAPGQGNIGVDQGFATGVAAQDLCIATRTAPTEIVADN